MKKICVFSPDLERTTRASSLFVLGVACLCSGLTVAVPPMIAGSIRMGLPDNNLGIALMGAYIMFACIPFMVLSGVMILASLYPMIYAYCIEDGKIIKGCLKEVPVKDESPQEETPQEQSAQAAHTALAGAALGIAAVTGSVGLGVGAMNVATHKTHWAYLTTKNSTQAFVETYFFSNCYKRKEYLNPVLVKETSKKLIYRCDNKRRLVIPKLYSNMGMVGTHKPASLFTRSTNALVFSAVVGLALACVLLGLNYRRAKTYEKESMPIVLERIETLTETFTPAGYEGSNPHFSGDLIEAYAFRNPNNADPEKPSARIEYSFGFDGAIKEVEFELYLSQEDFEDGTFDEEFTLVLGTMPDTFAPEKIDAFYEQIERIINKTYDLEPLVSDSGDYTIMVSRYNEYYRVKTITE